MTFRIFRNDALQKYRASFDLAQRYVFLAATAYDYESNLLGTDSRAGRDFLTDIIRQRSLGQMLNGEPIAGRSGLADPLARMNNNFEVLKTQLGFNNPQTETARFSLRNELFRLRDSSSEDWKSRLTATRVPNLWDIPEFRRYCRSFAPESAGPQPGMVIRFPSTVTSGENFFSWPLGGGDSAYDPSRFATKIRSVGVCCGRMPTTSRVISSSGCDAVRRQTVWRALVVGAGDATPSAASAWWSPASRPRPSSTTGSRGRVRPRSWNAWSRRHGSAVRRTRPLPSPRPGTSTRSG
jgi:hypothetical protein